MSQFLAVLDTKFFISIFAFVPLFHFYLYCTYLYSLKAASVILIFHDTLKIDFFSDLMKFLLKAACLESGSAVLFYLFILCSYLLSHALLLWKYYPSQKVDIYPLEIISFGQIPGKITINGYTLILIVFFV